mmetsp:Transcript_7326/g.16021  ORF Transcript_7326/g.16021 Transcript_7326/m.16021 type:complete len:82 (-) Transcript_7326:1105-1350(-)
MKLPEDPFGLRPQEDKLYEWLTVNWIEPCTAKLGWNLRGFCMFGPGLCILFSFICFVALMQHFEQKRLAEQAAAAKAEKKD